MTERARSGIPWAHELALRLGILIALAALVLLYCIGCDPVPPMAFTPLPEPPWTPTPTGIPRGGFRSIPAPTATPSSDLSAVLWVWEIEPHIEVLAEVELAMADLFESAKSSDATWIALVAAQVVKMREAVAALREIVPPQECREAHAMLLSATGDSLLGAEYTLKGIRQLDVELLEKGLEYETSGAAKMELFGPMLQAMTP
jgi:hypothetical protein